VLQKNEFMPRSVNAVASRKRRKKILKMAKGYFGARSKVYTVAKNAVEKGLGYAYRDRKASKNAWNVLFCLHAQIIAKEYSTK